MYDAYIERLENKALKHMVIDGSGRVGIDHADSIKKADYYIGSWLIAKRPVDIYSSPNGKIIASRNAGQIVGRIFSFVTADGNLYWQLWGNNSGNGGFVKHAVGAFDNEIALDSSSGKEYDQQMQALKDLEKNSLSGKIETAIGNTVTGAGDIVAGAGKTLSAIGGNFTTILIVAIALVLSVVAYKAFKSV